MQRSEAYWKKRQECFEEGFARGFVKGYVEDVMKALEVGIDRRNREITIAALRKGLDISLIMELTGLSLEEIEKLHESLGDE
jgi:predicted transposase YdaD